MPVTTNAAHRTTNNIMNYSIRNDYSESSSVGSQHYTLLLVAGLCEDATAGAVGTTLC